MNTKSWFGRYWQWKVGGCVALVGALSVGLSERGLAQIVPDRTLGAEGSVVKPNVKIKGIPSDRIDGGATRGANLFHSFQKFNVREGRGAYFANPTKIDNILTRVTGSNASNILGRLGVLGDANLFLLNPNGIVFGENASLDIQGSFAATTAERIQLGDSGYFSALKPQTSRLLSISPGALFFSQVAKQPTVVINQGNLSTGNHLTLSASNLDLQGQLFAGGNLMLQAQDTVKVRDSVTAPFLARSGEDLTIIGNNGIDILALNYPTQIPFVSGGNLSLISNGIISGDARFSSGGSFSIKSVSGRLANFVSLYDPIISANGNVDLAADYTGPSLLVEATDNIRFQGNISITGPDTSPLPPGPDTATLSTTPALIMRSGQSTLTYGSVNFGTIPAYSTGAVPKGITIGGNVTLPTLTGSGGIVNLLAASGNVSTQGMTTNGGTIQLQASGGNIKTGDLASFSSSPDNAEPGGAIRLEATDGSIDTGLLNSNSFSSSGNAGKGGDITLQANGGSINTAYLDSGSYSNSTSGNNAGPGGAISLEATGGNIKTDYLNTNSFSSSGNAGPGGVIQLQAIDGSINTGFLNSYSSASGDAGRGGNISLETTSGSINTGFLNSKSSSNYGNAGRGGDINLEATGGGIDTTSFGNAAEGDIIGYLDSGSSSNSGKAGRGGDINLEANRGNIKTDYLNSNSTSSGKAERGGDISLEAISGNIKTGNLVSFSSSNYGDAGPGGAIRLKATGGSIDTGLLNSNSSSNLGKAGRGGNINLEATGGSIDTTASDNPGQEGVIGYLDSSSFSGYGEAGRGGDISLEATDGINTNYLNSGSYSDSTNSGNAREGGDINLETTRGNINTNYLNSYSYSNSGNAREGGDINLETTRGNINTNYLNSYSSASGDAGRGGDISLEATGGSINTDYLNSNSFSGYGEAGRGGDISLKATGGSIFTGNLYSNSYASNYGNAGEGGDIDLKATGGSIDTGDLNSFSFSNLGNAGRGGDISLEATNTIQLLRYQYNSNTETFKLVPGNGSINATGELGSGNIIITSYTPFAYDNGIITSDTFGSGKGGDILISAPAISLSGGAQLSASTHSSEPGGGPGGNITLRASDNVELTGATTDAPQGIFSNPTGGFSAIPPNTYLGGYIPNGDLDNFPQDEDGNLIPPPGTQFPSGVFSQTTVGSTGSAGNLRIETGQLNINNGAAIATTTFGEGDAGSISVQADDSISVDNGSILSGVAGGAIGKSGDIDLFTRSLSITTGGTVQTQTLGQGKAGNIQVNAIDAVKISGINPTSRTRSGLRSGSGGNNTLLGTPSNNIGEGGDINVTTGSLSVADRGVLDAQTLTNSKGGNITVNANTLSAVSGGRLLTSTSSGGQAGDITVKVPEIQLSGSDSGLFAQTSSTANAGNLTLQPLGDRQTLSVNFQDQAQISASTNSSGQGGSLRVKAPEAVTISGNGQLSVETSGAGAGGNLTIDTQRLKIQDKAQVSASTSSPDSSGIGGDITVNALQSLDLSKRVRLLAESSGAAPAGNVAINTGNLTARNSTITTSSEQSSGGGTTIIASEMRLFGDSDITTRVNQGTGGGGNIYLKADSILAFDDNDILAYAEDGKGGDITLDTPVLLAQSYRPAPGNTDPRTLDNNNRVDINATGAISGVITTPDTAFIQNSLTELPENQIDTNSLLANSCIVRRDQLTRGSFIVTGSGGLPQRPGEAQMSSFSTVDVATLPSNSTSFNTNPNRPWQKGDPIIEPQGVYQLSNGKLVLSRECS